MHSDSLKRKRNEYVTFSLALFGITLLVAAFLSLFNNITAGKIAANQEQKLVSAMIAVLSEAKTFDDISDTVLEHWDEDVKLLNAFVAKNNKGDTVGYCIELAPNGYSNAIDMMVGITPSGEISDIFIISLSDTVGIGTQILEPEFKDQFIGKDSAFVGVKGVASRNGEIALISGATHTSLGFTDGVNSALKVYQIIVEEGVQHE